MFYFPWVEWVEKGLKWAKSVGGATYWVWVIVNGLIVAVAVDQLVEHGWQESKILFVIALFSYLGPLPFIIKIEKRRDAATYKKGEAK